MSDYVRFIKKEFQKVYITYQLGSYVCTGCLVTYDAIKYYYAICTSYLTLFANLTVKSNYSSQNYGLQRTNTIFRNRYGMICR